MLTETDNSRQIDRLGNGIRAYKLASGRTLAFAMIKTGRELAFALHKETGRITPSESTSTAPATKSRSSGTTSTPSTTIRNWTKSC